MTRTRRAARRDLVADVELSDARAMKESMRDHVRDIAVSIIQRDISQVENWARLEGLMSQLALPPRLCKDGKMRRPIVEIEIAKDEWAAVETLSIDDQGMTFSWGRNGSAVEYRFRGETCPCWRSR